jgi:plastocyanin
MSTSRPLVAVLVAGALCVLCLFAGPALVAGAAGGHARERHPAARRADVCRHHARHHRRCRTDPHAAERHPGRRRGVKRRVAHHPTAATGPAGPGGTYNNPTSAGGSAGAALLGSGSAPSADGSSAAGGQAAGPTETPAAEVPGTPAPARVQVIAKEYSFTLSRAEVPAGKVIVEFVNGGEDPHNLHLEEPAEGAEAGAFPTSSPGFHGDLTLNLRPGTYTLFCSLPGHEAKGMKATLTVH